MIETRIHQRLDDIPAADWDALNRGGHPFTAHAFLAGLEQHDCLRADAGWQPQHLALYQSDELIAAAPMYLKTNSHGEFVFDWSWAGAYAQHGLDYYPKLLVAVPYSPVTGPRLMVHEDHAADAPALRKQLVATICDLAIEHHLSSAHINFIDKAEIDAFNSGGWLERFDWQFHWHNNPSESPDWRDFDDFLAALSHKKRKNIRRERQMVAEAGIRCEIRHGDELADAEWHALYRLYVNTFADHGNYPALTEAFFRHLGNTMPRRFLAVLCLRGTRVIAASIFLRSSDVLYGRYWGATEEVPGLHFEACYYQGIEYCLREGLQRFEPGAQGEHKLARGFLPAKTRSYHWIAHPAFSSAIAVALAREARELNDYRDELLGHSPYRGNRPENA